MTMLKHTSRLLRSNGVVTAPTLMPCNSTNNINDWSGMSFQSNSTVSSNMNSVTQSFLGLSTGCGIVLCIAVAACLERRRIHLSRRAAAAAASPVRRRSSSRKTQIEKEIVTMRVQQHQDTPTCCDCDCGSIRSAIGQSTLDLSNDSSCHSISSRSTSPPPHVDLSEDSVIESDHPLGPHQQCPICFEFFQVGEVVSCAPEPTTCDHVFHHGCIQTWLLRHKECPYCRETFLPNDRACTSSDNDDDDNSSSNEGCPRKMTSKHVVFCQQHGLVRRAQLASSTLSCSGQSCMDQDVESSSIIDSVPAASPDSQVG